MMQVKINGKVFSVKEHQGCWENEPWDDAQDFTKSLLQFTPDVSKEKAR